MWREGQRWQLHYILLRVLDKVFLFRIVFWGESPQSSILFSYLHQLCSKTPVITTKDVPEGDHLRFCCGITVFADLRLIVCDDQIAIRIDLFLLT